MDTRDFRFGIVAGLAPDAASWAQLARRAEQLGYSTFLTADTLWTPSPFPALSAVAAVTSTLRVGTHVLAAPFRTPGMTARETEALDLFSGGRFELGLGIGRPDAAAEAERLGMPFGTPAERLEQVDATIDAVRKHFASKDQPAPRILLAGTGPRLLALAVDVADTVTLPMPPELSESAFADRVTALRRETDGLADLELAANVYVVGDEVPTWMRRHVGDLPADSYTRLRGTPAQMADILRRRRDELGVSYVTIAQPFVETFAPVIELLG